ncbi:cationic amino acid transporter 4-like [Diadema setosum]|uniref:cationic amino acid transporter 4-like n=1 Tax=Diadema setosum TaxID=31175 RepID=UPI003B3BE7EB
MATARCWEFLSLLNRKKSLGSADDLYNTPLRRNLKTFQLVPMGIGTLIGSGLYVLTGVVAKETTGPAIVISYAISGVAALLSAACFVEFACRIPRTGSAYTFTYISIGEIWAFFVGWNLILEYAVAAASDATAFIGYLDFLTGKVLSDFVVNRILGGNVWTLPYIAPYPNIFAAVLIALITVAVILGSKVSASVSIVFVLLNAAVVSIIIALGFAEADIKNWQDYGGFVPKGPGSIFTGAAKLFFAFTGLDAISYANEEAVNPQKSIPRATFISLLIVTTVYMLCSALLTLIVPYPTLDESSAFAGAFVATGVGWARWVVSIGALCGMFACILMSLYCLQRSFYAMAVDGLLFSCLGRVNQTTGVPIIAAVCSCTIVVILAVFFSLVQLVEFSSIGVLIGCTFVSSAVITLRYQPDLLSGVDSVSLEMSSYPSEQRVPAPSDSHGGESSDRERLLTNTSSTLPGTLKEKFRDLPLLKYLAKFRPGVVVNTCLGLSVVLFSGVILVLKYGFQNLLAAEWWAVLLLVLFLVGGLASFFVILLHEQNQASGDYYRERPYTPSTGFAIARKAKDDSFRLNYKETTITLAPPTAAATTARKRKMSRID